MPKKVKAPKGFAQLPDWWLEITPHKTLDIEADAAQRKHDYKEAARYANLAAKSDWEQQQANSKYTLGENGELLDKETGKPVETGEGSGYTQNEKGEWLKDGTLIFDRQFKPGEGVYDPSNFAAVVGKDPAELKTASLAHRAASDEDKPDWMKVKLKTTKKHAWLGGDDGGAESKPEAEEQAVE